MKLKGKVAVDRTISRFRRCRACEWRGDSIIIPRTILQGTNGKVSELAVSSDKFKEGQRGVVRTEPRVSLNNFKGDNRYIRYKDGLIANIIS